MDSILLIGIPTDLLLYKYLHLLSIATTTSLAL